MCERKPGPRCSNHAKIALEQARARHEQERTRESASARDEAQRVYESTPAGQRELAATVEEQEKALATATAAYDADGSMDNRVARDQARQALQSTQSRLSAGQAAREQQVTDLKIAQEREARYASRTPEEDAYVEHKSAGLNTLKSELAESQARQEAIEAQLEATPDLIGDDKANDLRRQWRTQREEVDHAQQAVTRHAERLYKEHGAKFGRYYASDMLENAREGWSKDSIGVSDKDPGPVRFKVKRNGPDKAATLAAREASKTDPEYQAATQTESEALSGLGTTRDALTEREAELKQHWGARRELNTQAATEKRNGDALRHKVRLEAPGVSKAKAQIAAGAGTTAEEVGWHEANDRVYRNPDGTTNAYVYRPPSDGFPDGVYVRATGISKVFDGMGQSNTLLTEDGRIGHQDERYSRPAGHVASGPNSILVTTPQKGATPLWEETGSRSWGTFIDSTD